MDSKVPRFQRGQSPPTASQLNDLARMFLSNIRTGPGLSVKSAVNQVVISLDDTVHRQIPGILYAEITGEVGAGTYTWTRLKGEGPNTGTAASTGVPDRLANEVNLETGVEVGKKVLLIRIENKWYFEKPPTVGGSTGRTIWASMIDGVGSWGPFGTAITAFGGSSSVDTASVTPAGGAGRILTMGTFTSGNFGGGSVPRAFTGWFGHATLPSGFSAVGSGGFKLWHKFECTGATWDIQFGLYNRNSLVTTSSADFHATAKVVRGGLIATDVGYSYLTIPAASLTHLLPGDLIRFYVMVSQNPGNLAGHSGNLRVSQFELDTGAVPP